MTIPKSHWLLPWKARAKITSLTSELSELKHAFAHLELIHNQWRDTAQALEKEVDRLKDTLPDAMANKVRAESLERQIREIERESFKHKFAAGKLAEWIRAAHRLQAPVAEGTIQRIMQEAQTALLNNHDK